jgi:hypothetical protein
MALAVQVGLERDLIALTRCFRRITRRMDSGQSLAFRGTIVRTGWMECEGIRVG